MPFPLPTKTTFLPNLVFRVWQQEPGTLPSYFLLFNQKHFEMKYVKLEEFDLERRMSIEYCYINVLRVTTQ